MLSRERVTCFTQLCSYPKVDLKPKFVFKGNGTWINPTRNEMQIASGFPGIVSY